MAKPIGALLLDLDDTLLDGSAGRAAALRTCHDIAMRRPDLNEALLFEANGIVWREYWEQVEDAWTLGRLSGRAVGIEAWRRTLKRCGYEDHALAAWARERHWQHRADTLRVFDDVAATLEALARRVPLALVTNGASDTQRHALGTLGIEGMFATVFISGERGIAKPAPEVFARVLGELGVAADHAWHVGDNLHTDVAGARAAGLTAVWLNRLGRPLDEDARAPNHEIRSLADLLTLSPELSSLP